MSQPLVANTVGSTPREHQRSSSGVPASATTKNALKPLIKRILPAAQPGLYPTDISDELMRRHPDRLGGQDKVSVQDKVRVALPEMYKVGEVAREPATGPGGGKSFRWTLPKNGEEAQDPRSGLPPEQQWQALSRASPLTPITPTSASNQLNITISPQRSAQEDPRPTSTGEDLGRQERSDGEEYDTQVARNNAMGMQSFQALSSKHDVNGPPQERNAEIQAERQDANSLDAIVELGRKVRRIHILRAKLAEGIRNGAEQRAQQKGYRERCTALECEVQENKARAGELEGEAQRLQEQLLLLKRRAAEHEDKAHRLGAEASEKKEKCAKLEVSVAESEASCTDLNKELSALKEALDIDWTIP